MSSNLIQIKSFLGKYYSELAYSANQEKYRKTGLNLFFEQKFYIQNNKAQMIVDPGMTGLSVTISGNEIYISKALYDHPNVQVTNSIENPEQVQNNPKSLYNADIFSTVAYLVCQNHTMFNIIGGVDEPIYIKYTTDFEVFYNSVIIVNISSGVDVEIVEEFESQGALNAVTNYIVQPSARLSVSTVYNNRISAVSFYLRNVIAQENSAYSHTLLGKGSSNVLDETKLYIHKNSATELLGCVDPHQYQFNTVIGVQPTSMDYKFKLDHRHIISGKGRTTFTPVIVGTLPADSYTNVSSISVDTIPELMRPLKLSEFLSYIADSATLERISGSERFYSNKAKFLKL